MTKKAELFEKKYKTIATIGPKSESYEVMKQLIQEGVNVIRLNMSHGDFAEQAARIKTARKIEKELQIPISVLLDTKGPEIRIHKFENKKEEVNLGDKIELHTKEEITGTKEGNLIKFSCTYKDMSKQVKKDHKVLIDDGKLIVLVDKVDTKKGVIYGTAQNNHKVSNNKAINIPGVRLTLPFISDYDRAAIEWGISQDIDYIAASFVSSKEDILEIREILEEHKAEQIQIMPKIESLWSLNHLNEILEVSDAVMLARGDLGVEIPFEEVPYWEKLIANKAKFFRKPIVIATHMLDSMEDNPRPTRAEVTDVYYAASLGVDAVMLSGESAAGDFPVAAVNTMSRIVTEASKHFNHTAFAEEAYAYIPTYQAEVAHEVILKSLERRTDLMIIISNKGRMIKALSQYRSPAPIVGIVHDKKIFRKFGAMYGVYNILMKKADHSKLYSNDKELKAIASNVSKRIFSKDRIDRGLRVIVTNKSEYKVITL